MMRKIIRLAAFLALTACAAPHQVCDGPRDGGIGGTGTCVQAPAAV